ncbi:MAG: CPBP family intramembrane metalloprotease [Anaerolineae bacterium]|nr:CPBP family intramembrane metalloprotease [Anaerolineae bacterium]
MSFVKFFVKIFWNHQEKRLRAICRLLLQLLLMTIISAVLSILLAAILRFDPRLYASTPETPSFALFMIISTLITLIAFTSSIWLAGKWFDRRQFKAFGFHFNSSYFTDFAFGLALGAVLMTIIFLIEWASGWITIRGTMHSSYPDQPFATGLLQTVILFISVGIYEELYSRGYMLRNLAEGLNLRFIGARNALILAWVISSAIFGALHAGNPNASWISTLNLVVAGLFLGLGFVLTGELAIPIGLHITWNFFQGNVFGFPVSGTTPIVSFIAINQKGNDLITGGAFGPEAGLIGLFAIGIGSVLTVLWVKYRYGQIRLKTELAQYLTTDKKELENETLAVGE